jgi:hypothetical protein
MPETDMEIISSQTIQIFTVRFKGCEMHKHNTNCTGRALCDAKMHAQFGHPSLGAYCH